MAENTTSPRQEWDVEREGRLAILLRDLARAESEKEKEARLAELRLLTRMDLGTEVRSWLAWYLEEHLGLRNAVTILTGKEEGESGESAALSLLQDEVVFAKAEYNWCAIEKIKNKDDMCKLHMLYSDLESTIQVDVEGPLSFRRLTGLSGEELAYFRGKSISQAIFDEKVEVRHLRVLKDYGKMMMMPLFPSATQRAGAIIYAAAISQALVRFDEKVTSLSYKDIAESFPGLLERPYVVESYRRLFAAALEKCR
ncbi:MAG: hypothetical protein N3A66_02120 [Planctomycetota bacterium]|nr:hypothetical protein [Planctomycetota bacterium]